MKRPPFVPAEPAKICNADYIRTKVLFQYVIFNKLEAEFLEYAKIKDRTIGLNQKGGAKMDKMDFNAEIMGILNDVLAQQERIIKAVKLLSEEIEKMKSKNK